MFFKNPLTPPLVSSEPFPQETYGPAPAGPKKGEFTELFGASTPATPSGPTKSEPLLEPASQDARFTDVFGKAGRNIPEKLPEILPRGKKPGSWTVNAQFIVILNLVLLSLVGLVVYWIVKR